MCLVHPMPALPRHEEPDARCGYPTAGGPLGGARGQVWRQRKERHPRQGTGQQVREGAGRWSKGRGKEGERKEDGEVWSYERKHQRNNVLTDRNLGMYERSSGLAFVFTITRGTGT